MSWWARYLVIYLLAVNILFMKCPFKYFAHFSFRSSASLVGSCSLTWILFDTCKADVKAFCGLPFPFFVVSLDEHVFKAFSFMN